MYTAMTSLEERWEVRLLLCFVECGEKVRHDLWYHMHRK